MDKVLQKKLVEKCPNLYSDYGGDPRATCMAWGFECGDGWFNLLMAGSFLLENHIEKMKEKSDGFPKAAQVKEKFGTLRFYMTHNDDYIDGVIDTMEAMSGKICDKCGRSGVVKSEGGWLECRCDTC